MDLTRRELLYGAGAAPLQGLPTLGGLALGETTQAELPELLARLERNIAGFESATTPPPLVARLESLGLPGETFHLLFAGLLTSSLVRDLPAELQADPRVQTVLQERLVGVGAAALWLRDLFRGTPAARLRAIGRQLREDPQLLSDLKTAMEPWFGPEAVEPERRGQVHNALEQLHWDLTQGDPEAVFAEQVRQIDRFERMSARLVERQDHEAADSVRADPTAETATLEGEDLCGELLDQYPGRGDEPPPDVSRAKWRRAMTSR